jgi:transcription elongation factor SPT6
LIGGRLYQQPLISSCKFTGDAEEEGLEEDDLALLEENTGASFRKRLTRLRRGRHSASPQAEPSGKSKAALDSSEEDDLDDDIPKVQDIQQIWDDSRGQEDDDMDDSEFITSDEDPEGTDAIGEDEKRQRREQRRKEKQRLKAKGGRPDLAGMDAKCVLFFSVSTLIDICLFQCLG